MQASLALSGVLYVSLDGCLDSILTCEVTQKCNHCNMGKKDTFTYGKT